MPQRLIRIVRTGFPGDGALDTALSRAMLMRASEGHLPETFRIHVPGRIVAFGKHDTLMPGYPAAVQAAVDHGFAPVLRLVGGRAAVFHERTLAFSWTIPGQDPTRGIRDRFATVSGLIVRAFGHLGIEARVGEIPGEYCPGEFSVNLADRVKVMGVGQRLGRRAAHIGGVIVIADAELVRRVLDPVYRELGLDWRPATAGSLADADPSVDTTEVTAAIISEIGTFAATEDGEIDHETIELARAFVSDHLGVTTAGRPL
jgi:lipoate-protein ligase A